MRDLPTWRRSLGAAGHAIPLLWVALVVVVPLVLALQLLAEAADTSLWSAWAGLEERRQTRDAFGVAAGQAALSTVAALVLGLPAAWLLGRYRWPGHRLLRAVLSAPFVVPTIVAAMAFIALLGPNGPIASATGIDLLAGTGAVGRWERALGWEDGGRWVAIVLAHAWFDLALVVRFVEPVLGGLDPRLVEQVRLLPGGRTRFDRLRRWWWPLLWPALAAAAALTFLFAFTSFAIMRRLAGPDLYTPERAMGELGGLAGIPGLGQDSSEVVLALASLQLVVMLAALGLAGWAQNRARRRMPAATEATARRPLAALATGPRSAALAVMAASLVVVLAPPVALVRASLRVSGQWTTDAWRHAFTASEDGGLALVEPLGVSIRYAVLTLAIALPLAALTVRAIRAGERRGDRAGRLFAVTNDLAVASPLALSAVMVGLGVLVGLLRHAPAVFNSWWLPVLPHVLIATPFAVRLLLPAVRDLDPQHEEQAALLGHGPLRRWWSVRLPLLRPALIAAASLVLAVSLGEFGATWVLAARPEWTTLPVFVDRQLARPHDLLEQAAGHVASVVLLLTTVLLFMLVDRPLRATEVR